MADNDVKKNFSEFGFKMLILAILSLVGFLIGVISYFVAFFSYIGYVIQVAVIVVIILALVNIGRINKKLNNRDLFSFRTKIIIALLLSLIGAILITVGIAGIFATIAMEQTPGI